MSVGYYFGRVLEKMGEIIDGDKRGSPYSLGFAAFCLFLSECAGRHSGRSKSIWLDCNSVWIHKVWKEAGYPPQPGPYLSQPTISRLTAKLNGTNFPIVVEELQKDSYFKGLKDLVASVDKKDLGDLLPIYNVDGKSREGCISEETGRTEVDLNIYNPETRTLISTIHLEDKQGERAGLIEFLENQGELIPKGIITADAGITSREIATLIIFYGHLFFLQLKGNAGEVYEEAKDLPWENVDYDSVAKKDGNGRISIRRIQVLDANFIDEDSLLHDYEDFGSICRIEYFSNDGKNLSEDTSYFIVPNELAEKDAGYLMRTANLHWSVETFHGRKDVTLKEDASKQKLSDGSRVLGRIRSLVDHVGQAVFSSTKELIDRFSAAPERLAFT